MIVLNAGSISCVNQRLTSLGGKLLRISSNGQGMTTNPFYTGNINDNQSKVYAYGLRNAYRFGISMEFSGPEAYKAYNEHPDHVRFVNDRWLPEVSDFLEVDYETL